MRCLRLAYPVAGASCSLDVCATIIIVSHQLLIIWHLANAALPHGGGADRILQKDEYVLVDAGGSLHGYVSDVTRVSLSPTVSALARWISYGPLSRLSPSHVPRFPTPTSTFGTLCIRRKLPH